MDKINCWEYKKCGREPGGVNRHEAGICPASVNFTHNGENGGKSAGRICWKVVGTLCGGSIQGTFAEKSMNCSQCDFYLLVRSEEGASFVA